MNKVLGQQKHWMLIIPLRIKIRGPITEKVTAESMQCQINGEIQLDGIEPPVVPSHLEFIETAEPEMAFVPTSSFSSHSVQEEQACPSHGLQVVAATSVDLGIVRCLANELSDVQKMQYLSCHTKLATLHSHPVTKGGKTWKVTFQHRWMDQFPWLIQHLLEGESVSFASFSLSNQREEVAKVLYQVFLFYQYIRVPTTRLLARMAFLFAMRKE